jgi:hypothetical protein
MSRSTDLMFNQNPASRFLSSTIPDPASVVAAQQADDLLSLERDKKQAFDYSEPNHRIVSADADSWNPDQPITAPEFLLHTTGAFVHSRPVNVVFALVVGVLLCGE